MDDSVNKSTFRRLSILLKIVPDGAWALAVTDLTVRAAWQDALAAALTPREVLRLAFDPAWPDPLPVMQHVSRAPSPVIVFWNLVHLDEWPLGQLAGFLDLQRENLTQCSVSMVLWATLQQTVLLTQKAPNFYSRLSGSFSLAHEDIVSSDN